MPTIIRAEYLSYYNRARNSDKLFNVFLIRDDQGTFSCLTENGRRGDYLVRRTVCRQVSRETAEQRFWEKVRDKRGHRETPYRDEPAGRSYSQLVSEYSAESGANGAGSQGGSKPEQTPPKVLVFPDGKGDKSPDTPKTGRLLNTEQFDSLEF